MKMKTKMKKSLRVFLLVTISCTLIFTNSCKKDSTSTKPLAIGQNYQGGVIAYILQPGDPNYDAKVTHGLIAAPSDQSIGTTWNNASEIFTGANGVLLGTGNTNTNTIVGIQGIGNYAAKLCADLVLGGYSDWYLPSRDELDKLYLNRLAIGGFYTDGYWSSTEEHIDITTDLAWAEHFTNGNSDTYTKGDSYRVRAIRSF